MKKRAVLRYQLRGSVRKLPAMAYVGAVGNCHIVDCSSCKSRSDLRAVLESFGERVTLVTSDPGALDCPRLAPILARKANQIVLLPGSLPMLERIWGSFIPTRSATGMEEAVHLALLGQRSGRTVLFAPAGNLSEGSRQALRDEFLAELLAYFGACETK